MAASDQPDQWSIKLIKTYLLAARSFQKGERRYGRISCPALDPQERLWQQIGKLRYIFKHLKEGLQQKKD